jgi:hypothetical protein
MELMLTAIGPEARPLWRHAVARDPDALVSQTPQWMDCACASGHYEDVTRAYAGADGHYLILPLARRRFARGLGAVTSMPFGWGTGGLVGSRRARREDVAAVVADVLAERPLFVGLRPAPGVAGIWAATLPREAARTHYMAQTVDLGNGFDAVWSRVAPTVRSHARKAERRGVSVERDDTGRLMPVFDALYRKSVDRWAQQQHEPLWLARWRARHRDPPQKFATVADRLDGACRVWVAWRQGEAIAAIVVLVHNGNATMWRSAMDKEAARGTGATELLHRMAISEACTESRRFYHLGDSAPSSALARNKRGFGAVDVHYWGYRFERVPLTAVDRFVRTQAKRLIGFRD